MLAADPAVTLAADPAADGFVIVRLAADPVAMLAVDLVAGVH